MTPQPDAPDWRRLVKSGTSFFWTLERERAGRLTGIDSMYPDLSFELRVHGFQMSHTSADGTLRVFRGGATGYEFAGPPHAVWEWLRARIERDRAALARLGGGE